MQKFTSACTSINSTKLPMVFKKVMWRWMNNTKTNLDFGGGKYDIATTYLRDFGITNYIYDPFNRSEIHNRMVLENAPFDTATLSNVLNVVMEEDVRLDILKSVKSLIKPYSRVFITVYEGNKSGVAKVNEKRNSCQLNRPLKDYVEEIQKVFDTVIVQRGMIIAW